MSSAPGTRLQERFEPDDRLDVEMVRRLVHQQDVGLAEQHARHRHAHLPPAGQRADVAVDPLVVEPEAVKDLARLRLERVAAEVLVLLLHFAEPREDASMSAACVRIAHRVIELLELVMQIADAAAAGDRLVQHRAAGHLLDVLPEIADRSASSGPRPRPRRATSSPVIIRNIVVLPEPFGPTRPTFFAGIELEGGVDEEDLPAVCLLMRVSEIMTWFARLNALPNTSSRESRRRCR